MTWGSVSCQSQPRPADKVLLTFVTGGTIYCEQKWKSEASVVLPSVLQCLLHSTIWNCWTVRTIYCTFCFSSSLVSSGAKDKYFHIWKKGAKHDGKTRNEQKQQPLWNCLEEILVFTHVLTSRVDSVFAFIMYHHHRSVFSVFSCRLCLNGKLVSQTTDSSKWL